MPDETQATKLFADTQPTDHDIVTMTSILSRVTAEQDSDRIKANTALLNSFNMAIQLQAGRQMWTPADFRAFSIALTAMDSIGRLTDNDRNRIEGEIEGVMNEYASGKKRVL